VLLLDWRRHCYVLLTALAVPLTTAALGACGVGAWHNEDAVYMTPAPAREQIVGWIDRFWPQSRVLIYGVQGPAVYPDPAEKRFLGRVDFCEPLFLGQARDEQIHLLVPPCDGRFYPLSGVAMADIHRNGRPWLLLERVWPGGWQLWRCVLPPVTESKLRPLERRPRPAARQ
jgi:hypothetical protein